MKCLTTPPAPMLPDILSVEQQMNNTRLSSRSQQDMGFFAKITESHEFLRLHPCAANLYRYGLRLAPAGTEIEFEVSDWQDYTAETRPTEIPYSSRQFYRAKKELENAGVLQIVRRSTNWVKAIFNHPETRSVSDSAKNGRACDKNGNTPLYREIRDLVCGETKFLEGSSQEEESPLELSVESQHLGQDPSGNPKDSGLGKYSAAARPEFLNSDMWAFVLRTYPAEAIKRAWENVLSLGDRLRDAVAVFMYSLKFPQWDPKMSATKFDKEWRDRAEESRQTYRERRAGERPARQRRKFLIPEGPWLNEKGQIRDDFMNWCLDQWVAKFKIAPDSGRSRDDVAGDVFKYFVNDPSRLETDWSQYCQECSRHIENSMLLLENDLLKPDDKTRFVRAAVALKANAEDPEADETDPAYLKAIALIDRINQASPKILGGESSEAIAITKQAPQLEPSEQDSPVAHPSTRTVDVSTVAIPAQQEIEPTNLPESEPLPTAPANARIARIMDAVRLKAAQAIQNPGPESETFATSPPAKDLEISQEQMWVNRDRLAKLMGKLDKSSQIQKPLSPEQQREAEITSLNSDLEWIEREIAQSGDAGEIARLRMQREEVRDRKKAIERETALAREQLQREQEEEFSRRKAEALRRLNAFNQSIGDPFGGLDF
jgi:hypothetical protein